MTRRGEKTLWLAMAVYAAALMTASLLPSGEGPLGSWDAALTPELQDALHLPAYAGLVVLVSAALATRVRLTVAGTVWIGLACVGLGAMMECCQAFIPGRTCSLKDGLVNAAGAVLGAIGSLIWQRCRGARPLVVGDGAAPGKATGLADR
jgi:VanZ family protein